jgi:hypothetical protein
MRSPIVDLRAIAIIFAAGGEAKSKYPYLANPNIADPGQFVDQIFLNVFNHVADPAGKAYCGASSRRRAATRWWLGNSS